MMTAPSTISPKSIAPRLIRLPLIRPCNMPMAVSSIESGIASAVISAARKLPSSRNSTTMTSSAPSARLFATVSIVASTSLVRLSTVLAAMSGGSVPSDLVASWRRPRRRRCGCWRRSASAPCRRRPPRRSRWRCRCGARAPIATAATSRTRIGTPRAWRRRSRRSRRCVSMRPRGADHVAFAVVLDDSRRRGSGCCARAPRATSPKDRPSAISFAGSGWTWYCFT